MPNCRAIPTITAYVARLDPPWHHRHGSGRPAATTQSAVVQIAYGFQKPVVVTSVGGLPDVVEDGSTGYVVPPNDPGAVAGAVVRFFETNASVSMARNIAASAERFSWERAKRALTDLVENPQRGG